MQRLLSSSSVRLALDTNALRQCLRCTSTQNVPAGHHTSDLSSAACNISLSRRRDITLRQDLKPFVDGKPSTLGELFKVRELSHDRLTGLALEQLATVTEVPVAGCITLRRCKCDACCVIVICGHNLTSTQVRRTAGHLPASCTHVGAKPQQHHVQGRNTIVIGLPDCGKVCKEKHLPGFVDRIQEIRDAGFESVVIASVTTPDKLAKFIAEEGAKKADIKGLADQDGSFTRMMGLELNEPGSKPPYSQRYICFVQDGMLVKIVRARCYMLACGLA